MSSGSSKETSQSISSNFQINTIEADSIDIAVNIANSFVNKDISLSHCKVLVVSEELAKQGIKNIVHSLVNKEEIRPDCNIIIAKIPQEEFPNTSAPSLEEIITKFYDISSNDETNTGYSRAVKLNNFYSNLNDSFCQPYATLGSISNPKENVLSNGNNHNIDNQARTLTNPNSEYSIETMGLAVFKDDVIVGTLTGIETMCHLLVINKFNNTIISIPSPLNPNETLDLYLFKLEDTKTKVKMINNSPFVTTKVHIVVRILSFGGEANFINEEKLKIVENSVNNYIKEQLYNYYDKTAKEFNSDIAGIGRFAARNFKTLQDWENYNWLENYKNSTFNVDVELSIRTGLLLTKE